MSSHSYGIAAIAHSGPDASDKHDVSLFVVCDGEMFRTHWMRATRHHDGSLKTVAFRCPRCKQRLQPHQKFGAAYVKGLE